MRTRFAPSPTGSMHVGNLRTALYAFLLARQTNGKFLIRIEDTDQSRSIPGAIETILKTLHWAGLDPDEGVLLHQGGIAQKGSKCPYIQSERQEKGLYRQYAEELLAKGHAYHCFCTSQRLDEMRKLQEARKQAPMYDRACLALAAEEVERRVKAGEPHVIRMKIPRERTISFADDIRGHVQFAGHTVDDQVLLKSDGFPTYHLAHAVDDHLMEIDIVIRGEEWLSSLPKHLLLFEFLGWQPPRYAHVPLLLNKDRTKLSKRQSAVAVEEYIRKGYLPETLINFLALLGWNPGTSRVERDGTGRRPGTTQELFTIQELIEQFSLERVQRAGAVFDTEKLDWLQGQWIRKIPVQEFASRIRPYVAENYPKASSDEDFERKAALIRERITFFSEAPDMLGFFYEEPKPARELLINGKQGVTEENLAALLDATGDILESVPEKEWKGEELLLTFKAAAMEKGMKLGQLLWPLRAALTGRAYSPGAVEVAEILGKEETMKRLEKAADHR